MLNQMMGKFLPKRKKVLRKKVSIHLAIPPTAAMGVIRKLLRAGFEAYLVGGAVRDLLLGVSPKDFDVVTNATPEQVRDLFKHSRIIGRRFPIVHVMAEGETVEVSTFRNGQARQNVHGRIVKDNAYGTMEQDAVRRDFTCNALYYDVVHHQVIDFHHGLDDIKRKTLVMIGEPAERYLEDPVRILRAVRLAGKLGFKIEEGTLAPIAGHVHLLKHEPVSRLFDELMKILFSGHAQSCLKQIQALQLTASVHPLLSALQSADDAMTLQALQQTDERLQSGKSVSMGFILAALLWKDVSVCWRRHAVNQSSATAMQAAIHELREDLEQGWGVPQRYLLTMREIWLLQPSFEYRRGGKALRLLAQPRFRAAYDFLLIRAAFGEVAQELADWWTDFQAANEETRRAMITAQQRLSESATSASSGKPKKKRQRSRKKKTQNIE